MVHALALISFAFPVFASAFSVNTFHPQGLARSPRQVRAVFSEPMVAFGDPRGLEPFEVQCSVRGKGIWEDSRTWIYEFAEELSSGESCRFQAKKELKSERGGTWEGKREFSFGTGGPAVKRSEPADGSVLEQQPAFLLTLDGPVDIASVEKNAYLLVEGLSERVPLKVLSGKIRDEIARRSGGVYEYEDGAEGEPQQSAKIAEKKPERIALESLRALPPDTRVRLVWGKGIRSPKGQANTKDQHFSFQTEKEFTATVQCQRENEKSPCAPIGEITVTFSSLVQRKDVANAVLLKGEKVTIKPEIKDKNDNVSFLRFAGPFPPNTRFTLQIPNGLKDERGRSLANAKRFPLDVSTGGYPPLAKFAAPFGILEAGDPVLPVTLRSLEPKLAGSRLEGAKISIGPNDGARLINWVLRLQAKQDNYIRWDNNKSSDSRGESLLARERGKQAFELPKPNGGNAFEVVGIPLAEKGFHVVEIESRILGKSLLGKPTPMYVASGALVTNLAVHLKWGAENSLFWVTQLDSGLPVKGAKLRATDCKGKVIFEGKTDEKGTALAENFPSQAEVATCSPTDENLFTSGIVVVAEKNGDFSFVHSGWDNGIENWRFQLPTGMPGDESIAHTVFDRTLLRAGQTVHMKHFLRERFLRGIRFRKGAMPRRLVLLHSTGRKIVMPLKFNEMGEAESEWKIPKEAALGGYEVYLTTKEEKPSSGRSGEEEGFQSWDPGVYQSGSFRLEEFRIPVMAGSLQWPKGALVAANSLNVDISVRYLSGGAAAGLPIKLRARAEKMAGASFADFEGFQFANGFPKAGRTKLSERQDAGDKNEKALPDQQLTLDQGGSSRAEIKGAPVWDQPTRISIEAEYRDPNGEIQTVSRSTVSYPSAALVGIQPSGWVAQRDRVKFNLAVVNPEGKPLAGRKVKVSWFEKQSFSHRKRIVGGFYAYENFQEIRDRGLACQGSTDDKGLLACEEKAPTSGNLMLVAEVEEQGKKSRAHHEVFIAGAEDWWFAQENDDRIDLLPGRKAYEPGETAHFQVRSPFRKATALITVEREGIIDHFVQEVDGKNPVLELPIKESYAPNIFLSALLVRGRVGEPKATATVDLARPAHKLGLAQLQVGWRVHRLNVSVEADRKEFKVREKAKVKLHVVRALDGKPAANGEVMVAAVDEALLELKPNNSWNLLEGMMGLRQLKVQTATAQSQVIGKRHFGLKALPPGGGGGTGGAREFFDTLLFWKATLPLNAKGEAEVEVPMNDSLSSFRIVAVASENADRFGTGSTSVQTRQDLMLFSGVSPLARNGDKANPEVTVRNASERALKAEVTALVDNQKLGASQIVELTPGEAKVVSWSHTASIKGAQQTFEFQAKAGEAHDLLKVTQKLEPALRESVLQATLQRVDGKLDLTVEPTKGILPESGGVYVKLEPSLAADLDSVKRYMSDYPFGCLEQMVSIAVALRDATLWKAIAGNLPSYIDPAGLVKYFPESLWGSDVLSSYLLSVTNEAGYEIPEQSLKRLVTGLQGFIRGTDYHTGFVYPAADLAIRKLAAMEALSRYQSFDPKMLGLIRIEPELWPIRAVLDWYNLLRREQKIEGREKKLAEARQILRTKLEWRGTVVGFKGDSHFWWLMNSMDEDANRFLLAASVDEKWNEDIGRLARGVISRMSHGHWDLTNANAWGVLAVERFSQKHEKESVSGLSNAELAGKKQQVNWGSENSGSSMSFTWPKTKSALSVTHSGGGKPWALVEARAAVKLSEPIFKGYRLKRSVVPVEQRVKGKWSRGDVYRVTLTIEAPSDMTWVAISDPIPAGATVLGSGLENDSSALTKGEKRTGLGWGVFEERGFSGFRAYHEWMPKGSHQLEYTVRLNGVGSFQLPNSRVEAMYAPEMYAETPNEVMAVQK